MKLTEKQLKVFNRLHKKYPVSLEFIDYNLELLEKIKVKSILEPDESNNDIKTQSSVLDLNENSLSNSTSIVDLDVSLTLTKNDADLKGNKSIPQNKIILHDKPDKKSDASQNKYNANKEENPFICNKNPALGNSLNIAEASDENFELNDDNADTISNSDSEHPISELEESALSPEQIELQLKTQLELLKYGKRSLSLLSEKKITDKINSNTILNEKPKSTLKLSTLLNNKRLSGENSKINNELEESGEDTGSTDIVILKASEIESRLTDELNESIESTVKNKFIISNGRTKCSIVDSFEISEKDALEAGPSTKEPVLFTNVNRKLQETHNDSAASENDAKNNVKSSSNKLYDNFLKSTDLPKKSTSIVDSLISKLVNNLESRNERNDKEEKGKPLEKTISVKTVEQINNLSCTDLSNGSKINDDNSSSSDDFFGFNCNEMIQPQIPGMLPTPAVPTFSNISAFISKDDKPGPIKTFRYTNLPKRYEEGLVHSDRPPPKFEMAALPDEMSKPRTLAEKRMIFSKQRSFKYFMIENENTIYHELKRRTRDGRINTSFVRAVQRSRVPASRDLWKATCWLLTENEKFYFQTADIDGRICKILSGLGNFPIKKMLPQYSSPIMKKDLLHTNRNCSLNCTDRKTWQCIRVRYKNPRMKMQISQMKKIKMLKEENRPGPLCFKKKLLNDLEGGLNELEIYRMPKIELEVYPKLNKPLDDYIKSYLKLVLPSESITKEWAEFAVSTLVEKANQESNEINHDEDKGKIIQAKNSFKFTIPYLNDQTHILVRKVLRRSENFDNKEKLKFRSILENSSDKITIECADVLSDMIDSVAIGLSENSFIYDDPDITYDNGKGASIKQSEKGNKFNNIEETNEQIQKTKTSELKRKTAKSGGNPKSKLMKELKRLNATIINASDAKIVAKPKVCEKDFCRLGCICASLGNNNVPKNHCKKINCMLEKCSCPLTLIEAENSVITSEDAFVLRQKATARLARMEREFTSTVVLTGNETLLINENQTKRKRRNNARLTNYYTKGLEDEEPRILTSSRSRNATPTSANSASPSSFLSHDEESKDINSPVKEAKIPNDISGICYVDEDIMKLLKHCTIDLYPLKYFDDKVKWCMVHCLYKCFCNGKDTEGKPYILKKLEEEKPGEVYSRKAKYSFDKSEDESLPVEPQKKLMKTEIKPDKTSENISKQSNENMSKNKPEKANRGRTNALEIVTPEQKHKENRIISAYINNDFYGCHRVQPVPRVYRIRNKRPEIKNHWRKFVENDQTKFLLIEKVRLSESYVRKIIVKRPPGSLQNSKPETNNNNSTHNSSINNLKPNQSLNAIDTSGKELKDIDTSKSQILSTSNSKPNQQSPNEREADAKQSLTQTTRKSDSQTESQLTKSSSSNSELSSPLLKISSVFSLNDQRNTTLQKDKIEASNVLDNENDMKQPLNEEQKFPSLQFPSNCFDNCEQFTLAAEQVQKEVMKRLNFSVTKTMHNITKIQSEDSANIPNPQVEMMVAVRWKHFLQYYIEDKLHIWEVKIEKATYFVGTMKYAMPYVVNAIGVINIKAVRRENLPLFAQMLNSKLSNAQTDSLSILMNGHRDYWRILGMTKSINEGTKVGVIRPTTESHPNLTPKINKLFNILTQQYIENLKRKSAPAQLVTPTSIANLQNANKKIKLDSSNQCNNVQINQLQKPIMKANQLTTPTAMVVINNNSNLGNLTNSNQINDFSQPNFNNSATYNKDSDKFKNLKMNIKIRKLTREEAMTEHFQVPITSSLDDHRWLVLDLEDDFSHIIFMNSMEILAHSKIKLALQRSQTEKKMVRFPKVDGRSVDCYIMKFDKKRIYLGPFHETIDPVLMLYQNVDGKMVSREDYEASRGIKRLKHTTGFWLCRKNEKIMFDMEPWTSDISSIQLQQQNQQNIDKFLKQHQVVSTPYQSYKGISYNENSLIQLLPENMPLIQSQCDNVSVSGFPAKNIDLNTNMFTPTVASNVSTESVQQVIKQVNKMYKKPFVISSITSSAKTVPANQIATSKSNISENSVLVTDTTLNDEPPAKKRIFSKMTNDSITVHPNIKPTVLAKSGELIIETQKILNSKDQVKTTQPFSINNISVISSNSLTQPSTSLAKSTVYGPHMRTAPLMPKPMVPLTNTVSSQRILSPISSVQKAQFYTTNNTPTSTTVGCKPSITPTTFTRPLKASFKSKESGESNSSKPVIDDNKNDIVTSREFTAKGPVTAEVEEQNGQLILKLPENLQNKILSQQFTVSKSENGTLILEPASNTNSTLKSVMNHENNNLNKQLPQSNAQNNSQDRSIANSVATTTIPTTENATIKTLSTSPITSMPVGTQANSSIPICTPTSQNVKKNEVKVINSSGNTSLLLEKKVPSVPVLKTKELPVEKHTIKTIITKISKPSDTKTTSSPAITSSSSNNERIINKDKFLKIGLTKPTTLTLNEPITVPKIGIIDRKCSNTKTAVTLNQNQDEQLNKNKLIVKNNIEMEKNTINNSSKSSNIPKSDTNVKSILNTSNEKQKNESNTKVSTEFNTNTNKAKNFGIYYPEKYNPFPVTSIEKNKNNDTNTIPTLETAKIANKEKINTSQIATEQKLSNTKEDGNLYSVKKIPNNLRNSSSPSKKNNFKQEKMIKILPKSSTNEKILNSETKNSSNISEKISVSSERVSISTLSTDPQLRGYTSGYFVAPVKDYPKFGGYKRGTEEYLIKTNSKSVLHLTSIAIVAKHLNGFVKKQCPAYQRDVEWEFVAFKNQQSFTTNHTGKFKKIFLPTKFTPKQTKNSAQKDKDSYEIADMKISELKDVIVIDDDEEETI
ncbi:uncharacterized protein LOC129613352 [Condylostylus longicornis]|uniref:uncharacterized protein LOC129613352 n=1 Tax=Condylostylus longicornis TaxID=2530218 RepID=UPI00244DED02|nr:uncharacterized protein LOC129613352 [Condylostylus longicornis]